MAKDDRVFKVVYTGRKADAYRTRTAVGAMFATYMNHPAARSDIKAVYACNAEATSGWEDVTAEFRGKPAPARCLYHKTYTGKVKPKGREGQHPYYAKACICWGLYCANHPEYPRHLEGCSRSQSDPAQCPCQVTRKLLGE